MGLKTSQARSKPSESVASMVARLRLRRSRFLIQWAFSCSKQKSATIVRQRRDPYDIYYYCRSSEEPGLIRQKLKAAMEEPAMRRTVAALQRRFQYEDSKWVDLAPDQMRISGEERDR